jgi:hypothetical protein
MHSETLGVPNSDLRYTLGSFSRPTVYVWPRSTLITLRKIA